jgi:uncharacterized membrane protein
MSTDNNPSSASLANPSPGSAPPPFRRVNADQATAWLREGWELFKRAPGIWIAMLVIYLVIVVVASLIPFIGALAVNLFGYVFIFGMLSGTRDLAAGKPLTIGHLFAGFASPRMGSLILLGVLAAIGGLCIGMPMGLIAAAVIGGGKAGGLGVGSGMPMAILVLALIAVFSAALLFAAPLVGFRGLAPVAAVKLSFAATLANWVPLLLYGVLALLLVMVGAVPFGLGLLVVSPMLMASYYCMYRAIFPDE